MKTPQDCRNGYNFGRGEIDSKKTFPEKANTANLFYFNRHLRFGHISALNKNNFGFHFWNLDSLIISFIYRKFGKRLVK